ncbi:MAG: 3-methyl-2-oxobutanoate hydroxymethyltransferase [bacterium]
MYGQAGSGKLTAFRIRRKKEKGEKIVALTAYDWPTARVLDESGVDLILVGDSAANVCHGMATTVTIGMDEMLMHTRSVAAGVANALVVADMPFLSYQASTEDAVRNAGRFLKVGAEAVKLEGATAAVLEAVRRLVEIGIPVLGHVGLTPQSVHGLGGYRLQARTRTERESLLAGAVALEAAGCFAVVLEKVAAEAAAEVTRVLKVPTVGIGAGPECDGQVLVLHDMVGLTAGPAFRFVKRYAELGAAMKTAVEAYAADVRAGRFPDRDHSFYLDDNA